MNKSIELDGNQAGIVIQALEDYAIKARELGDDLILGTNNRQAGFNQHQNAEVAQALADALDRLFPVEDD